MGMACHNYDGDMLTDEVSQVHRSPGFMNSVLVGKAADGTLIKEFEASHGTVSDLWHMHLRGEETSMNPLGMVEALLGAMDHSAAIAKSNEKEVNEFTKNCRASMYQAFRDGRATRDMVGKSGLTTEQFVETVAYDLKKLQAGEPLQPRPAMTASAARKPSKQSKRDNVDKTAVADMFRRYDTDGDGSISFKEFVDMAMQLRFAPLKVNK